MSESDVTENESTEISQPPQANYDFSTLIGYLDEKKLDPQIALEILERSEFNCDGSKDLKPALAVAKMVLSIAKQRAGDDKNLHKLFVHNGFDWYCSDGRIALKISFNTATIVRPGLYRIIDCRLVPYYGDQVYPGIVGIFEPYKTSRFEDVDSNPLKWIIALTENQIAIDYPNYFKVLEKAHSAAKPKTGEMFFRFGDPLLFRVVGDLFTITGVMCVLKDEEETKS